MPDRISKLAALVKQAVCAGPTRAVVHSTGEATTPERAAREYCITPTIIYIRDDGWSLGAPAEFEHVAREMWSDLWVAVAWKREGKWLWRPWDDNGNVKEVMACG